MMKRTEGLIEETIAGRLPIQEVISNIAANEDYKKQLLSIYCANGTYSRDLINHINSILLTSSEPSGGTDGDGHPIFVNGYLITPLSQYRLSDIERIIAADADFMPIKLAEVTRRSFAFSVRLAYLSIVLCSLPFAIDAGIKINNGQEIGLNDYVLLIVGVCLALITSCLAWCRSFKPAQASLYDYLTPSCLDSKFNIKALTDAEHFQSTTKFYPDGSSMRFIAAKPRVLDETVVPFL